MFTVGRGSMVGRGRVIRIAVSSLALSVSVAVVAVVFVAGGGGAVVVVSAAGGRVAFWHCRSLMVRPVWLGPRGTGRCTSRISVLCVHCSKDENGARADGRAGCCNKQGSASCGRVVSAKIFDAFLEAGQFTNFGYLQRAQSSNGTREKRGVVTPLNI
jgi:hypothetical protein